jgi:hypothetical protein
VNRAFRMTNRGTPRHDVRPAGESGAINAPMHMVHAVVTVTVVAALGSFAGGVKGQQALAADTRSDVIGKVLTLLEGRYVYPDVARRMADAIRAHVKAGRYDGIGNPAEFAARLSDDLRAVSNDKHLRLLPPQQATGEAPAPRTPPAAHGERLDGNIGYLRLDGFPPAARLATSLDPLMKGLAGTDALLIDLRENRGGAPDGAMYLAGYLLPKRQQVARIFSRPEERTTEMWTEDVPGPRYLDKPVFVLTSGTTFSAAEAFIYHMVHLGRVRTVGEATGGGAHRVQSADAGHGFTLVVPFTRPINLVTNADWEGTGIPPSVASAAADAHRIAHREALRSLPPTPERTAALERIAASGK